MSGYNPKQSALERIERIEKRYKKPENRKAAVYREGIFWSDIWSSLGLIKDQEYKEAMEVYSNYLEGK